MKGHVASPSFIRTFSLPAILKHVVKKSKPHGEGSPSRLLMLQHIVFTEPYLQVTQPSTENTGEDDSARFQPV